jgi:hypothetical protein
MIQYYFVGLHFGLFFGQNWAILFTKRLVALGRSHLNQANVLFCGMANKRFNAPIVVVKPMF